MPVIRKIVGPKGSEFWGSFDLNNYRLVAEALKEEFQRSEPAHDIHYTYSGPNHLPSNICNIKISLHCFRHCLIFLLRGVIFVDGQGALIEPGYVYVVRDEEWIGLGGNTTIFVMEEGEMKGICAQKLKEEQKKYWAEKEAAKRKQERPWNKMMTKVRRGEPEVQQVQCATQ